MFLYKPIYCKCQIVRVFLLGVWVNFKVVVVYASSWVAELKFVILNPFPTSTVAPVLVGQ